MPDDPEHHHQLPLETERTHLLGHHNGAPYDRRLSAIRRDSDAHSIISSHVSKDELALGRTPLGERLPYNDYSTIDWLHDLVRLCQRGQESSRAR